MGDFLAGLLLALVLPPGPDCLCGHPRADHAMFAVLTGRHCHRRQGWRRRRCRCPDYTSAAAVAAELAEL